MSYNTSSNSAGSISLFVTLSAILFGSIVTMVPQAAPVQAATAAGIIVPLYTYPTSSTWDTMAKVKATYPSVPTVAIVNPDNGPGGAKDANYVSGIQKLQSAGITVLGYVSTVYTSRSSSAVKTDIDAYKSWYPSINGIFFDEMANWAGGESYYKSLNGYAKSKGYTFTVGNPGTDTLPSYIGTVDSIIIYETDGLPLLSYLKGWHTGYDKKNFAIIPYKVGSPDAAYVTSAAASVGYMYLTNDDIPNPWDSLPWYYSTLASTLNPGNVATSTTSHTVTIQSVGVTGMWTTVKRSDGSILKTGYTPLSFAAKSGAYYQVSVANYGNHVFDHWSNGSTNPTRTISVTKDTTFTAYYRTLTNLLTIKSVGLTGSPISGLWIEIHSGVSLLKTGYTPMTYTVKTGQSYTVAMGEWQNLVFDHWENGSTSSRRTINLSHDTTIIAYFRQ